MAGFIPEITTRVHVETDTSELDEALSIVESDSFLSQIPELSNLLNEKKNKLTNLEEPVAHAVAEELQSNQEIIISTKHYITGMMANSVDITGDGRDYLVGNTATSYDGFPYPLAIETGRREVYPIDAKVLRWFNGGQPVFSHYSSGVDADPFVQPSIDETKYEIEQIVSDIIGGL